MLKNIHLKKGYITQKWFITSKSSTDEEVILALTHSPLAAYVVLLRKRQGPSQLY